MTSMPAPARLRALVVEDEWPARNYLVELLEGSGLAEVVGAVGTADEARQALTAPDRVQLDVVFLDVQLAAGEREGLDIVRSLGTEGGGPASPRGRDLAPLVVLATASREHALEAFELGVLDYLLKPFSEERVEHCLRRIIDRRPSLSGGPLRDASGAPQRIVARRKKSLVFLDADEVWAFEASHRLTFVHTPHGIFDLDLSLSAIEASFGRKLTRVHRSWLVNPTFVKELEREGSDTRLLVGSAVGQPGVHVPVARERAQELKDLLLANATGLRRG